jgi:hypothetical protein
MSMELPAVLPSQNAACRLANIFFLENCKRLNLSFWTQTLTDLNLNKKRKKTKKDFLVSTRPKFAFACGFVLVVTTKGSSGREPPPEFLRLYFSSEICLQKAKCPTCWSTRARTLPSWYITLFGPWMSSPRRSVRVLVLRGLSCSCLAIATGQNALLEQMFLKTCTRKLQLASRRENPPISTSHLQVYARYETRRTSCTSLRALACIFTVHVHVSCMMHICISTHVRHRSHGSHACWT